MATGAVRLVSGTEELGGPGVEAVLLLGNNACVLLLLAGVA